MTLPATTTGTPGGTELTPGQLMTCKNLLDNGGSDKALTILEPFLQRYKPGDKITHGLKQALLYYADAQRHQGHYDEAYRNYCTVVDQEPALESEILPAIFKCLPHVAEVRTSETVQRHLIAYLKAPGTLNSSVDQMVISCLKHQFRIDAQDRKVDLQLMSSQPLFLTALSSLRLNDAPLELFINSIRTHLLHILMDREMLPEVAELVVALNLRAFNNEYVNYFNEQEGHLIDAMLLRLEAYLASGQQFAQVSHVILALLMYIPLTSLPRQKQLSALAIDQWPAILRPLRQLMLADISEERRIANNLTSLGNCSNAVSKKVRQQYEGNPYPRWNSLYVTPQPQDYLTTYSHLKQTAIGQSQFEKPLNVLIAGCGTGAQPISLAGNVSNIKLTAIDISKNSLAYGIRMAAKHGIQNIDFLHADILQLAKLNRRFDIIECSGVLHHLENPQLGLKHLLDHLKPGGLLNLGLYSELARRELNPVIEANRLQGIIPSPQAIREFRHGLLKQKSPITRWYDFHSLSSCRDLLFHEQEHQFTIPSIQQLLEDHGLTFLGFHSLKAPVFEAYLRLFPSDRCMTNLENWHHYERQNPNTFKGMYQFHCQKDE